jgi:hypothetical protein
MALGAAALLGACTKHIDDQAYGGAPPTPPAPEQPQLMGGPADAAATATQQAAMQAQVQAASDAYVASLPPGLMAVHKTDPATGRTILVVSNYPVPNPLWNGGHPLEARAYVIRPPHHTAPVVTASAADATAKSAAPSATAATPTIAAATTAPAVSSVSVGDPQPTVQTQTAGFKGVTLSPGMWLIGGGVLLAIIVLIMLAGRRGGRQEPIRA